MIVRFEKNKGLFSKLQSFSFLPLTIKNVQDKAHFDVETQELLLRVKNNISKLSEANMKMGFMLDEIQSVIRKKY